MSGVINETRGDWRLGWRVDIISELRGREVLISRFALGLDAFFKLVY